MDDGAYCQQRVSRRRCCAPEKASLVGVMETSLSRSIAKTLRRTIQSVVLDQRTARPTHFVFLYPIHEGPQRGLIGGIQTHVR